MQSFLIIVGSGDATVDSGASPGMMPKSLMQNTAIMTHSRALPGLPHDALNRNANYVYYDRFQCISRHNVLHVKPTCRACSASLVHAAQVEARPLSHEKTPCPCPEYIAPKLTLRSVHDGWLKAMQNSRTVLYAILMIQQTMNHTSIL